jgi:two-component system OmpR family sensor kinase
MKERRAWLLTLLPAALGAAAAAVLSTGWVPDPRLRLWVGGDVAGLALAAGLLASAIGLLVLWGRWRQEARYRRQLAAQRAQASNARWRFLQRLDHELKNPLQAIISGLANVRPDLPAEIQEQGLAIVRTQVQHLTGMVQGLRQLADLETRQVAPEEVDVAEVLRDAVDLARDGFRGQPAFGRGHRLVLNLRETPRSLPPVSGDRELLLQAIRNLLDNACKFSPPGSPVEVWAAQDDAWIRIEVADKGQGIPPEDLPHMGEELYRGRIARSVPGSGLGLALARTIVERHGGRFAVDSQVGQGTLVTIHLPVAGSRPAGGLAREG